MRIGKDGHSASTKARDDEQAEAFRSELVVSVPRTASNSRRVARVGEKTGIGGFETHLGVGDVAAAARRSGLTARRIGDALAVLGALDKSRQPSLANVMRILGETKRLIDYVADRRSAPRPRPKKKAPSAPSQKGAP